MALFTIRVHHTEDGVARHRFNILEEKLDLIIYKQRKILSAIDELKAVGTDQERQVLYDKIVNITEQIKTIIP